MIVLIITPLWRYSSEREVQLGDLDLLDVGHLSIVDPSDLLRHRARRFTLHSSDFLCFIILYSCLLMRMCNAIQLLDGDAHSIQGRIITEVIYDTHMYILTHTYIYTYTNIYICTHIHTCHKIIRKG